MELRTTELHLLDYQPKTYQGLITKGQAGGGVGSRASGGLGGASPRRPRACPETLRRAGVSLHVCELGRCVMCVCAGLCRGVCASLCDGGFPWDIRASWLCGGISGVSV